MSSKRPSEYFGVTFHSYNDKWVAVVKGKHLGYHKEPRNAAIAVDKELIRLGQEPRNVLTRINSKNPN